MFSRKNTEKEPDGGGDDGSWIQKQNRNPLPSMQSMSGHNPKHTVKHTSIAANAKTHGLFWGRGESENIDKFFIFLLLLGGYRLPQTR